ncbi:hypothetical protein cpbgf_7004665 [Cryptosporidium parvum]|uniref:Uncharacterized protein n=1 Tax=Cryptosporidium parvum TaxID=5807 RepID=A0A7S7LFK3_CRYPV|nr:hypothetical protein CPATCC_0010550 [Cryptosporidium parvum]WRK33647.1 hypothetical protein cpbgf_7004665 [Cryptosporidium parvum]|eukprot:QOY40791.1 hypothetical protein CPATCC_003682 [Cryptosporidium parvum]
MAYLQCFNIQNKDLYLEGPGLELFPESQIGNPEIYSTNFRRFGQKSKLNDFFLGIGRSSRNNKGYLFLSIRIF